MKKFGIAVLLAVLVVSALAGVAYAQGEFGPGNPGNGDNPGKRPGVGVGQITALDSDSLTVTALNGEEYTLLVDEDTKFRTRDGEEASFDDLSVDSWVAAQARKNDSDEIVARVIVILPEDFEPPALLTNRVGGEVTYKSGGSITVLTAEGESVLVKVDDSTQYRGDLSSLDDLAVGDKVLVITDEQEDGSLLATMVAAGEPKDGGQGNRPGGNQGGGKQGNPGNDNRGNNRPNNDRIEQFIGEHAFGVLSETGTNSLTIERRGESLTFTVNSDTLFLSADGSLQSLSDLESGQPVLVLYDTQEDGSLLALAIGAGQPRPQNTDSGLGDG